MGKKQSQPIVTYNGEKYTLLRVAGSTAAIQSEHNDTVLMILKDHVKPANTKAREMLNG